MKCPICQRDLENKVSFPVTLGDRKLEVCEFDFLKIQSFIDGSINGSVINILWGAGRIGWSDWYYLRGFLRENNIKEVLEFGSGLSSELFIIEGMDLVSCDILKHHIFGFQKHLAYASAVFIPYPDDKTLPDLEARFPGRKWDFVFVDGPQERSKEVRLAMKLSKKFIFLHDPLFGEQSFFPNEEWNQVNSKLFCKAIKNG